jgi:adenylate cyclase
LRFKLIFVISTVIVLSLSGMIFLATYYFKGDNRIRVQQANLDIAKILALKVRSDFLSIIDTSKAMTNEMLARQAKTSDALGALDKTFLFHGIASQLRGTEKLALNKTSYNKDLLEELQINQDALDSLNDMHAKNFVRAFGGDIIVENASPQLRFPVMALAYPIRMKGRASIESIAVNYVRLDKILLAFKGEDRIGQVFMVNEQGDVIAHQEGEEVLAGRNYQNLPIVKEMFKSPQTNGQIRYKDENGKFFLGSFWKIGIGGIGIVSTVEEDVALRQVYDMQRRNLYLMVIVLTMVIMIVFFALGARLRPYGGAAHPGDSGLPHRDQ